MIRLPYTGTYSLELVTAQNGAQVVVCYSDATSTAYTGGTQATSITSATTTAICATPAASTIRDVDEINIKNTYAGSHTITVQLDANGTNYPILTAALGADESLNYTHGSGWQCKDANGNTKSSALTAMTSAQLAGIISDETGSGALVFATSPTLVTPALGTPSSGTVTNLTGTASININGTVGATTPTTGAFTTVSSTGNASLGNSVIFDAHTLNGKSTVNDLRIAAVSASLPTLTFVDACFHLAKDDTDKGAWRKNKGQSWRSEARSVGKYLGAYTSTSLAVSAGGVSGDVYYNTTSSTFREIYLDMINSTVTYRAGREDYPTNALITAEAARIIIWDLDTAIPSMWGVLGNPQIFTGNVAVCAIDNVVVTASTSGCQIIDYMTWTASLHNSTSKRKWICSTHSGSVTLASTETAKAIASATVNDVAITILPDAPYDEYGMPVPTIAAVTAGGGSVINNNGVVRNSTFTNVSTAVSFDSAGNLYAEASNAFDHRFATPSDYASAGWGVSSQAATYSTSDNGGISSKSCAIGAYGVAVDSQNLGLVLVRHGGTPNAGTPASNPNYLRAYITSTYNTGYMVGDIRRCFLSNSKTVDRSVKAATLTEVGTVTETTYTGGRSVYSGFSAANYFQEASHADWNALGTGDFSIVMSGVKWGTAGGNRVFVSIGDGVSVGSSYFGITAGNRIVFATYTGAAFVNELVTDAGVTFTDTSEHIVEVKRISAVMYIVVDGVVVKSGASTSTISNATGYLCIGERQDASQPLAGGQVSTVRISATAPTTEQSKFIAATENALNGGNACLLSNSNIVSELSYDKDTDTLLAGNGTNVDTFSGLKLIASQAHGVTTLTGLASINGRKLIAGTGATYTAPDRNVSAELLEAQVVVTKEQQYSFTTPAATTTQALPQGWKARGIAFNITDSTFLGTYTQTFDGFIWTLGGLTAIKAYQINLVEA